MAQQPSASEKPHNTYLSTYTPSATIHHAWRTAQNSASYLLPTLSNKASKNSHLKLLDIGAGSGTITSGLAKLIPNGEVTALDISADILSQALAHAKKEGVENVKAKVGNVYELPFEDGTFDIIHVSQVLAHLDDPISAIKEMVRVTKKDGGVIAIRESDLRAWSFYPEAAGLQKFNDALCAVHDFNGGNVDAGKKLVSWFLEVGIPRENIQATAGTWCYSSREERQMWGGVMIDRIESGNTMNIALREGIVTEEDVKQVKEAWESWIKAEDGWFGCLHGEVLVTL